MVATVSAHGFVPGGETLDKQLVHGAFCGECHDFLRGMSADRCCRAHYLARYGRGWAEYRRKRAAALEARKRGVG